MFANTNCRKVLKPLRLCTKDSQKDAREHRNTPGYSQLGDPAIYAPTQLRLARTHDTHDTHKRTRTKRNRSPGYRRRTSQTNSHKPSVDIQATRRPRLIQHEFTAESREREEDERDVMGGSGGKGGRGGRLAGGKKKERGNWDG